jgi:hypothetical protein
MPATSNHACTDMRYKQAENYVGVGMIVAANKATGTMAREHFSH